MWTILVLCVLWFVVALGMALVLGKFIKYGMDDEK